jgi:hypothetical protein
VRLTRSSIDKILHRLHVEPDAGQPFELGAEAADHLAGAGVALGQRLEADQHAPAVERGVAAIHADEGRQAGHRRVLQHHVGHRLLALGHRGERDRLPGLGDALDRPGVLHREEALGHQHIQQHRERQRAGGHQREPLARQHPFEHHPVAGDHPVEEGAAGLVEAALLGLGHVAQQARAHHRGEGEGHEGRDQDRHRHGDRELRNSRPTTSAMNSSGISTAISEMVSEMIVKPICFAP